MGLSGKRLEKAGSLPGPKLHVVPFSLKAFLQTSGLNHTLANPNPPFISIFQKRTDGLRDPSVSVSTDERLSSRSDRRSTVRRLHSGGSAGSGSAGGVVGAGKGGAAGAVGAWRYGQKLPYCKGF